MKLQQLVATGVLAIAAAGAGYYGYTLCFDPPLVTTSIASVAPVSEAVYGTGTVEPERWAKVVPLQRRRLVELCRCEGQVVKCGQILGRQDDAEERSALDQMEINRGQLERDLTRAEKDRDKNDAARTEYEQRWTRLEEAKSRIAAQKVRLDSLTFASAARRHGAAARQRGRRDRRSDRRAVLGRTARADAGRRRDQRGRDQSHRRRPEGFPAQRGFPGRALRATVSQITPKGDPTRKTFRVYLRLPQDTPLRIGMSVETNIIFREKQAAIVVPAEAVAAAAIQIVEDGRITRMPVKVGIRGSRNVEIIGDVARGTAVLSPASHGSRRRRQGSHRQQPVTRGRRRARRPRANRSSSRSRRANRRDRGRAAAPRSASIPMMP